MHNVEMGLKDTGGGPENTAKGIPWTCILPFICWLWASCLSGKFAASTDLITEEPSGRIVRSPTVAWEIVSTLLS